MSNWAKSTAWIGLRVKEKGFLKVVLGVNGMSHVVSITWIYILLTYVSFIYFFLRTFRGYSRSFKVSRRSVSIKSKAEQKSSSRMINWNPIKLSVKFCLWTEKNLKDEKQQQCQGKYLFVWLYQKLDENWNHENWPVKNSWVLYNKS